MSDPTGQDPPITIENETLRLVVEPAVGGGVRSLHTRPGTDHPWTPLLRETPDAPAEHTFNNLASYPLAPWCNRIPRGELTHRGETHQLGTWWTDPPTNAPSAIHGVVCRRPAAVTHQADDQILLRFQPHAPDGLDPDWPWRFAVEIGYRITTNSLHAEIGVRNDDGRPMPAGVGFHPYFPRTRTADDGSEATVHLRAHTSGRFPARSFIPTGPARDDGAARALRRGVHADDIPTDHTFAGWNGLCQLWWPGSPLRVALRASDDLPMLHIFTQQPADPDAAAYRPPPPFLAAEPVSHAPDAFNLAGVGRDDLGAVELGPGERLRAAMEINADWR